MEHVVYNINKYTNLGEYVAIVFIFAKPFDMVDHSHMIDTLNDLGVRGMTLGIFKNYFSNLIIFR